MTLPPRRLDWHAVLWALLVLAAGVMLGGGAFWMEQSRAAWRPTVQRTTDGWRVTTPVHLRPASLALSQDAVVWNEGPYAVMLDRDSGGTRLLSAGRGTLQPVSASGDYVAWSITGRWHAEAGVWTYRLSTRRRAQLPDTSRVAGEPSISGQRTAWVQRTDGGDQRLLLEDLATGARTVEATGSSLQWPVLSGDLLAWVQARPQQPPVIAVLDTRTRQGWQIAPFASASSVLQGMAIAGRTLVFTRTTGAGSAQLVAYELDSRVMHVLASGVSLTAPAADGELVVWGERGADGSRVRAQRLSQGTTMTVATTRGSVVQVAAAGDTAAWAVEGGGWSFTGIETTTVPQGGQQAGAGGAW